MPLSSFVSFSLPFCVFSLLLYRSLYLFRLCLGVFFSSFVFFLFLSLLLCLFYDFLFSLLFFSYFLFCTFSFFLLYPFLFLLLSVLLLFLSSPALSFLLCENNIADYRVLRTPLYQNTFCCPIRALCISASPSSRFRPRLQTIREPDTSRCHRFL